jgi:hypothetical protein
MWTVPQSKKSLSSGSPNLRKISKLRHYSQTQVSETQPSSCPTRLSTVALIWTRVIHTLVSDLKSERNRLDKAISALERLPSRSSARRGRPPKAKQIVPAPSKKPRGMSAAGRRRISEANKKRWALWHGKSAPKRKPMSPAARKRLSALMKERWAKRNEKTPAS